MYNVLNADLWDIKVITNTWLIHTHSTGCSNNLRSSNTTHAPSWRQRSCLLQRLRCQIYFPFSWLHPKPQSTVFNTVPEIALQCACTAISHTNSRTGHMAVSQTDKPHWIGNYTGIAYTVGYAGVRYYNIHLKYYIIPLQSVKQIQNKVYKNNPRV